GTALASPDSRPRRHQWSTALGPQSFRERRRPAVRPRRPPPRRASSMPRAPVAPPPPTGRTPRLYSPRTSPAAARSPRCSPPSAEAVEVDGPIPGRQELLCGGIPFRVEGLDLVVRDVEVEEADVGRIHSNGAGVYPRLTEVGLVAADEHRGDHALQQMRRAEHPDGRQAGNDFVVTLGQVRQHRDTETRPAWCPAVRAVERVDREVR